MIYPRKRIQQQNLYQQRKKQGSTLNSQQISSNDSKNKRKYFISTYKKIICNNDKSKININKDNNAKSAYSNQQQDTKSNLEIYQNNKIKKLEVQQNKQKQLKQILCLQKQLSDNVKTFQSQEQIQIINIKGSKKKFKLFCELKKKRKNNNFKKNTQQYQFELRQNNQLQKNKKNNSQIQMITVFRQNLLFEQSDKQKPNKIRSFINKDYKIKSKQKQKDSNLLTVKNQLFEQKSSQSSNRSRNSSDKKQSTVNVKRSLIRSKFLTPKTSKFQDEVSNNTNSSNQQKINEISYNQIPKIIINQNPTYKMNLLDESRQKLHRLSQILEERHQETVSNTIRVSQNSMDQTSLQLLGINSICKNTPYPTQRFNCTQIHNNILSNNSEMKQSAQKKSLESSLSEMEKSRPKIRIQKFSNNSQQNLLKIGQMGSQISKVQENMSIINKIQLHIQMLNCMADFVCRSTQIDYLMQDWDELNFLIYKKLYIQRMKVLNFLKKYPIKNPFCLKLATIQTKDLIKQMNNNALQIMRIKNYLQEQNISIKKNLQLFFNNFTLCRHGQRINLFEYDNFSSFIFKQIWAQIQLFSYSRSHCLRQLEDRIFRSLQVGFLVSQVNGRYVVPFQNAEIAEFQGNKKQYIQDNLKVFQRYVLNKNR